MSNLRLMGCAVDIATTGPAALATVRYAHFRLLFCEAQIGDDRGIDLVPKLLALTPSLHVILMTDAPTIAHAVQAIKAGAADYCAKPLGAELLRHFIAESRRMHPDAPRRTLHDAGRDDVTETAWPSGSLAMRAIGDHLARAATTRVPVLLRGESGTGKGLVAQWLHAHSTRATRPFVTINCPTLTDELLTSELFGHIKGAFTGAIRDQVGKVTVADQGTLFLDELGELSPGVQAKLLRFLQERTFERLGDTVTHHADVRIIAATNRDLGALVRDGRFREDLLYRLNVIELVLPPLRDRPEDILALCDHFLTHCACEEGRPVQSLSYASRQLLLHYHWPGNIRELRNELQRISVLWPARVIEPEAFSTRICSQQQRCPVIGGIHALVDVEEAHIRKVLAATHTFGEAAQVLGITESTLWRKRQRLGR
jgi:NtrC-family two-component system response regulator AlgB